MASNVALGQSLSIVKKGESGYWIEASAPPNVPHALQASENLHLWVNIHDDVQGQYSYPLDEAGVSRRFFRLTPWEQPEPIRVVLVGDSMTADSSGWGQGTYVYFRSDATVINYATPNSSSKTFLRSEEMDKMLVLKPDYVLIQYGFVDAAWGPDLAPDHYTTLEEFGDNLRAIVNAVRGFDGVPILVTLHSIRRWDENGRVTPRWEDRNGVTIQVAAELQTPLINLYQLTMDLFNELGPNGCGFMQWAGAGPEDLMHLSPLGAQYVARLLVNDLPDNLGPYLMGIFDPPPKP